MVSLPTREQIFAHRIAAGSLDTVPHAAASRADLVPALCADLGIECVDMLPALQASIDEGIIAVDPRSGVFNPEGHRVIARVLSDKLRRLGWFAPAPPPATTITPEPGT